MSRPLLFAVTALLICGAPASAQETEWLSGFAETVTFVRTTGVYGAEVGDEYVWRFVQINASDTAQRVSTAETDCRLVFGEDWIGPGETTCDPRTMIAPADSAVRVFRAMVIAQPDSLMARPPEEFTWPPVLYSWEVTTDSLDTLPSLSELEDVSREVFYKAKIQAARGAPRPLEELASRYSTLRITVHVPVEGRGLLVMCPQHGRWGDRGCSASELREFSSPWVAGVDIAYALEQLLARHRQRLVAR